MNNAAAPLVVAVSFACQIAHAQSANDPMGIARACSVAEGSGRRDCLHNSPHEAPSLGRRASDNRWLVSETTSPIDYSPVVAATTSSVSAANGAAMQLSIHCRAGRTEVTVAGALLSRSAKEYVISYQVNADPPIRLEAASPSFGSGVSFGGDAIQWLKALPDDGSIVVRLSPRIGAVQEGHFQLDGFGHVREKLAAACKWPHSVARPGR